MVGLHVLSLMGGGGQGCCSPIGHQMGQPETLVSSVLFSFIERNVMVRLIFICLRKIVCVGRNLKGSCFPVVTEHMYTV